MSDQSAQEVEAQFRLLVESVHDYAIFLLAPDGSVATWNPGAQRFKGYTAEQIIGRHFSCFYPPEEAAAGKPARDLEVAREEGFYEKEGWRVRKDGSKFWATVTITTLRDATGKVVGFGKVTRDTTARALATERFRIALEGAPTGMIMVDMSGLIVLVNAQVEKLFGYTRSELIGQPIELLVPKRLRDRHPGYRSEFFADPLARPMGSGRDLYGLRKDGSEVPIEIGLNPLRTSEGSFVLSSVVDITERKRSMEQFRSAIEAAPTGMMMVSRAGSIVLVNVQVERLFGYTRDELIGKPVELLVPERFRERHPAVRGSFFSSPRARQMGAGRDLFGVRKDGSEVPIEIGLNPLQTTDGDFVLSSIVDITERKRAESEKESLLGQLRELNTELEARVQARTAELREREMLLQEVHHRVKNNLQVISSLINMQVRRIEVGESRDALAECQTRVQAIALIHETLYQSNDFSRVHLADYARTLIASVFQVTGTSPSAISVELSADEIALTPNRAIPCGLILNELMTNALKHAFKGRPGAIWVDITRLADGRARVCVRDNGVGMPAGFDLRTSESLGLQLIQAVAEQLEGTLEVSSDGDGATFAVLFPMEP